MYQTLKKAQPRALRIIENSIKNNRMSHAYLFVGGKGTYKKEMAYHFALSLYCKHDDVCYECTDCMAILENRHMNIYYIEPLGQTIRKEQIIALQEEFSKTSLVPGPRVYIINEAHLMSVSAANSLLKFIEEPVNEETYGILITEHKDNILPTIISRSMVINFEQIDKRLLKEQLLNETDNLSYIDCISVLTSNLLDAKKLLVDEEFNSVCNVIDKFVNQIYSGNPVALFYRANLDVLSNRERMKTFLVLLECLYRDIYEYQINEDVLVFTSYKDKIKDIALKIKSEDILKYLFQILELVKKIGYNVNINLLINQFLFDMDGGA